MKMDEKALARFEAKYVPEPNSGCWLWLNSLTWDGYGRFYLKPRTRLAHRVSYIHYIGDIPENLELDHKCHTRSCCNPDHLEPVTHIVNKLRGDRAYGDRNGSRTSPESYLENQVRGERQGSSKLIEETVKTIRELYDTGAYTQKELAVRFGVARQHISKLVNYKEWRHI